MTRLGTGREERVLELLWLAAAERSEGGEMPSWSTMERLPVRADFANDRVRRGDVPDDDNAAADGRVRRLEVSVAKSRELDR